MQLESSTWNQQGASVSDGEGRRDRVFSQDDACALSASSSMSAVSIDGTRSMSGASFISYVGSRRQSSAITANSSLDVPGIWSIVLGPKAASTSLSPLLETLARGGEHPPAFV